MNRMKIGVAAVGVLAFLPAALPLSAQAQEKSGVAAAVNPNAVSTPPGQTSRTLLIGAEVIFRERIATQADGQVQLIFLDESSLTVGPGSDVTIDEFVYDPKAKTGKMSVKIAGGLVRFVGGRISKNGDVTINTPVSVIGIRGGMGYVEATPTSATATNLFGTLSVKGAAGGEQIVSRPGFAVTTDQGQIPASPVKVDPAQLVRLSKSLEAPPQAAARNASGAIEGKMDRSQVSEKNSDQAPASISPDATAQRAESAKNPTSSDFGLVRQAVQQNVTSTIQNSVIAAGGLSGELFIGANTTTIRASDGSAFPFKLFPATFTNGRINSASNIVRFTLSDGTIVALGLPARGSRSVTDFGHGSVTSYQAPDGKYFFVNTSTLVAGITNQVVYTGGQAVRTGNYTTSGSIIRTYDFVTETSAALKFTGSSLGTYANKVETPYILRTQPSGNFADSGQARTVGLYAGLGIDGQGIGQKSGVVVATGQVFQTAASVGGNPADTNVVRSSFNDGVSPVLSRVTAGASTPLDGKSNAFYGADKPDYFTLTNLDYATNGTPAATSSRLQSPGPNGSVNTAIQFAYGMAPSASGASNASINSDARTARTMNGYVGGIMGISATGPNSLQIKTQGFDPVNISLTTDPSTNRLVAKFKFDTLPTAPGLFTAGGSNFNPDASRNIFGEFIRYEYNFGGITGTHRARSAFINDGVYAATEQRLTADATFGSFSGNGSQTNQNPTLSPVGQLSNDPTIANLSIADRTNASDALYLVSSAAVPITGLLPAGIPLCECSFLSWGWWGGNSGADDPGGSSRSSRMHLANYVVGVLPSVGQIPTSGSATYVGNAIGTVKNGSINYIAAGGFQKTWDFASRSGTMTITNFDGGNYSATSTAVSNPGNFAYSGTGTRGAVTVNGSFFSSPTDPVKAVGGQFLINQTGNPYRASGIVIGQR